MLLKYDTEAKILKFMEGTRHSCNSFRWYIYKEWDSFEKLQTSLREWLTGWRKKEGIDFESDHFFLEDRPLEELSIKLIRQANVERCHLSNALMEASKRGLE